MGIFQLKNSLLGIVESVDTSTAIIKVTNNELLKQIQINNIILIQGSYINQNIVGLVSKIIQKSNDIETDEDYENSTLYSVVKVLLIGTHYEKEGTTKNKFKRNLAIIPCVNAECHLMYGDDLKIFMQAVSKNDNEDVSLKLGKYSIDEEAIAYLNGDKFFQRHAVIVGSTGSGKSWAVAKILEEMSKLAYANAILFDIHGEYAPLVGDNYCHYKIAGPSDNISDNILFLPYWLLSYEEMISMMLDRTDNNAPNQATIFSKQVFKEKCDFLVKIGKADIKDDITLDSPIPYDLNELIKHLNDIDTEMVDGARGQKKGPFNGTLTRFIQRLENKKEDKRLNFLFNSSDELLEYDYMNTLCKNLLEPAKNGVQGIKIIDFSEVPSDVLPLIVSLIARIIFSIQQWTDKNKRFPIALFCDEAHLYIPSSTSDSVNKESVINFERIAKEGRKYGVSLVVISQRPSEVNRTVLSQSNNFIAMRLTNNDDQNVVRRLMPDNLGDYSDMLPILDVGEAIMVGDACLLPSRIKIDIPLQKPTSATVEFWKKWKVEEPETDLDVIIEQIRKQKK